MIHNHARRPMSAPTGTAHAERSRSAGHSEDVQAFWDAQLTGSNRTMKDVVDLIDPNHLVDKLRNGEIPPEILSGSAGQAYLAQIKEKASLIQTMIDAIRGIQDIFSQGLRRIAENIGR